MNSRAMLYLNMILKEDEPVEIVKRSIDSVKNYVDGMYIAVTYKDKQPKKTAPLVKLLEKYGANILYFKWVYDFSKARQFVLDNTPKGRNHFIYWQDADDVCIGAENLRKITEDAHALQHAAVFADYLYQVDIDPQTNEIREVIITHKRERVIRNDDTFRWIGMLHETLIAQREQGLNIVGRPELRVLHLSNDNRMDKNLDRNIEILEKQAAAEQHRDPRTLMYLAKAYFDRGKAAEDPGKKKTDFDLALALFHGYLEGSGKPGEQGYVEGSGWPEERSQAYKFIGEIAFLSQNYKIAVAAFQSAIDEYPYYPDYYVNLAFCYVVMGDHKRAKQWLACASATPMPNTSHIVTPRDLKIRALECSYQISIAEQRLEEALKDLDMMIAIMPNEQQFHDRRAQLISFIEDNKAATSIVYLGKYLEKRGDNNKLVNLVQAIPDSVSQERFASEMRHKFLPPRKWESNEIAILCGPGFEQWSPLSANGKGLGGSEEAVVYLSQELTKLGWKVTVFANPGTEAGEYDGVSYKMWFEMNIQDQFNALILWRNVGAVDAELRAKFTMVWLHDMPNNPDFTEERVNKIDKFCVQSEYHKSQLRVFKDGKYVPMPDEKVFLSANGIPEINTIIGDAVGDDPTAIVTPVKRNPHSMIYASSPDRGLVYLLNNWPRIRAEVPDATLDVYYGFQVFDAIHGNNPTKMKWKEYILEKLRQPGITYHGRVGHHELHEAYAKVAIWAYPTDFTEISCISAMKAQTLGAIPVCTTLAALDETVKNGIKVDVDVTDPDGEEEYFTALIELLKDEQKQEEIRPLMMNWARQYFPWKNVAMEWSKQLKEGGDK